MKICVPIALLALILLLAPLAPAAAAAAPGGIDFTALDAAIAARMDKHGLPGVALAVVEGGEIVYRMGYGSAGIDRSMTAQTPMLIGSQSKSFTALAIAQLAEAGKPDLDAPVRAYIPWFRVADENASARITLNHLLHHTSGLSDAGYGVVLPSDATPEQALRSLAQAQLTATVGSKHQYFNMGYSVLSYIIEIVSRGSYAEYIQAHILAPLGMTASTADPFTADALAQGYTRLFGFPIPMQEEIPTYGVGEGYIVSTAEDMARYAIAIMNGGAGLVSPETCPLDQARTPPAAGTRHGHAGFLEWLRIGHASEEALVLEPRQFLADADSVAVVGYTQCLAKPTGKRYETDFVHLITFKDGKIERFREFFDTYAAAEAFRPE